MGVAVGQSTPASIEAADLHLRDITLLPLAVSWSGQAVKKMKAALFTSIVYNLLLIPGAAFGWVTPGWAAVAMGLSSVSVVLVATSVRVEH